MVIRNRLAALIYRSLISVLGIIATIIMINLNSSKGFWNSFFAYPTIITLLGTLIVISETIANAIGMKNNVNTLAPGVIPLLFHSGLALEVSLCTLHLLASIVYKTRFFDGSAVYALLAFVVFPSAYVLDWLLFGEKGTVRWSYGMFPLFFPIFHYLLSFMTHFITGSERYITQIFDPESFIGLSHLPEVFEAADGWVGVLISTLTSLLAIFVIDYLLILLNNLLAGRYSKKIS